MYASFLILYYYIDSGLDVMDIMFYSNKYWEDTDTWDQHQDKMKLRPSDVVWIWFKSILNIRRAGLIPPDLLKKKKKKSLIGTALMVSINHFAIWDGIWECFEQRSDVNLFQTDIEGICNYIFLRLIPIQYIPDMQDFKNKSIVLWEYPKQENSIIYLHKKENHPCKK